MEPPAGTALCDRDARAWIEGLESEDLSQEPRLRFSTKRPFRWVLFMTACSLQLPFIEYVRLRQCGVPPQFIELLKAFAVDPARRTVQFVEFFCGHAAITLNFQSAGYQAVGYDRELDPTYHDMLRPEDYIYIYIYIYIIYIYMSVGIRGINRDISQ